MSGHSKWSKIQHKKGKNDAARGASFTKLCSAVTVAASQGGGDPEMNFGLRLAVERAKSGNVPKDNIDRAIKRGTGELKDDAILEEITYEGFGPSGVAFVIDTVTDNRNRTVSDVKYIMSKGGGSLGSQGSVQWQFEKIGIVRLQIVDWSANKDELELTLIDAGADDILSAQGRPALGGAEGVEVRSSVDNFKKVLDALTSAGIEVEDAGIEWVAKEVVKIDEATQRRVEALHYALDEHDDVKAVYTNSAE